MAIINTDNEYKTYNYMYIFLNKLYIKIYSNFVYFLKKTQTIINLDQNYI